MNRNIINSHPNKHTRFPTRNSNSNWTSSYSCLPSTQSPQSGHHPWSSPNPIHKIWSKKGKMMIRLKLKQKQKKNANLGTTMTQKKLRGRKRRKYKLYSIESPFCSKILMKKSTIKRKQMLKPSSLRMDNRMTKMLRQIISNNQSPPPVPKRK